MNEKLEEVGNQEEEDEMKKDEKNYKKQLDAYEAYLEEKKLQEGLTQEEQELLEEVKSRKKEYKGYIVRKWFVRIIGVITICSLLFSEVSMPFEERVIAFTPVKNPIVIEQKGEVRAPYTLTIDVPRAMLSRDGSTAYEVESGTVLVKPGLYYLSKFDEKGEMSLEAFEIPLQKEEIWEVTSEEDLVEVFKYAMENMEESIELNIHKDWMNEETIYKAIQKVRSTFPITTRPQRYEMNYTKEAVYDKHLLKITFDYNIGEKAVKENYKQKLEGMLQYIMVQAIEPQMTDLEKEYSLLDYIVKNTAYSQDRQSDGDYPPLTHTIYGAIVDNRAVCDGYSKELNYLLNAVGVPSQMIIGESRKQGHQWNLVEIGGSYYHVDVTWADSGSLLEMRYINQNDKSMQFTHTWEKEKYPVCEATGSLLKPHFETKNIFFSKDLLPKLAAVIPVSIIFLFVFRRLKRESSASLRKQQEEDEK
ncbi:hypothetical protein CS063_16890 [Sporanaerobium hydrogeniformans]|uniref:Uncharacterized protein n=1 Tax=Sporanaerobium hydrogeniformans TaxID=3072179 RepID=A0AC61D6C1_9FIRM|nr:transglutaminase domain-containing protein [Sporanaerobium hydrogeniformans]PHV69240.1 hypothetical protein CS063_16890 [Sporanaerobium hydrogeniformans]